MIELQEAHTGEYLAGVIFARLKIYGINLKQILTITTDNGPNILKMVRDVDQILQETISSENNIAHVMNSRTMPTTSTDDQLTDEAIAEILAESEQISDDQALDILFDEFENNSNEILLSTIANEMEGFHEAEIIWDITGMNCAAHTLQLAIKDALDNIDQKHKNLIQLCRRVAKILRLKSTQIEMKNVNIEYKSPRTEVETRWCFTFLMVISL